ncbi:MAG TPA: hypothetical protein VKB65_08820, partial [Myxococcota bacterium]|nr:hypothetical protein [Myxococcota bacterium]
LQEPIAVPAGSRLRVTAVFDNSEYNPANPDPDAWVRWGLQSSDEMLLGYFLYRDRAETESAERWRRAAGESHARADAPERHAAAN